METDDLFHSSLRRIAEFSQLQVRLYRHDVKLQDYFMQLQLGTPSKASANPRDQRRAKSLLNLAIRGADTVSRFRPRPKYKADVLFCPTPYYDRRTENRLTIRTLLGLAQTDAKVLCLLEAGAPFRKELDSQLAAMGRTNQVEFVDPIASLNSIEMRFRGRSARMRASSTLREIAEILDVDELDLGTEIQSGFEHTAYYVDAWERLASRMDFDAVVSRCHWNTICSSVCRTGLERGKEVVTFQQGVIGHTLDVPVNATKYVAFGQSSASFLARVNHHFFQAAKRPEPPVKYVQGGSFIDRVEIQQDQFDLKTLLLVDVQVNAGDFYGVATQCQALLKLAERLLTADLPLRRLIIRPHPHWSDLDLESVQSVVREHSARCELSHPAWALEDDLRRSSAVLGIFSGVLTVASASGLPTYFLRTLNGFTTEDLSCFSTQALLPEDAFREIGRIFSDREAYAMARKVALENAREYYVGGSNLDFSPAFFERLLAKHTTNSLTEQSVQ